jgi:thiosulfate dehydrogenase [quinone] large subunit
MTTQQRPEPVETGRPVEMTRAPTMPAEPDTRPRAGRVLAITRITLGFVFLWAFLDKTFGFGYATPVKGAWIHGGSPTAGFLGHLEAGPLGGMYASWAGVGLIDWLFMVALLGVGVALILGIGLRIAAVAGSLLMLGMWLAEWPIAQFGASGPTMSTNPLIDYHVIYALVLIVCAVAFAGRTWGLGNLWERLPIVRRNRWLV